MRNSFKLIGLLLALFLVSCMDSPVVNYEEPTEGRLLLGATVHLGNGEYVENAALGVKDGYVTLLADDAVKKLDLKKFQVIDWVKNTIYILSKRYLLQTQELC